MTQTDLRAVADLALTSGRHQAGTSAEFFPQTLKHRHNQRFKLLFWHFFIHRCGIIRRINRGQTGRSPIVSGFASGSDFDLTPAINIPSTSSLAKKDFHSPIVTSDLAPHIELA